MAECYKLELETFEKEKKEAKAKLKVLTDIQDT